MGVDAVEVSCQAAEDVLEVELWDQRTMGAEGPVSEVPGRAMD